MKLPGWTRLLPAPVWEHTSGIRIHSAGIAIFPDGTKVTAWAWPDELELQAFIRRVGGSRHRGVMAWALKKAQEARP